MPAQIEALRAAVERLPRGLVEHIQRMVAEAKDLGHRYGLDERQVELAAWGHDIARHLSPHDLLDAARRFGLEIRPAEKKLPILLHGAVGAEILRRDYGIDDPEVLAAVRFHTTGRAEMSTLEKVIFVADKIEEGKVRSVPSLAKMRELAQRDLDAAVEEYFRLRPWASPDWTGPGIRAE
jgi:predicted HD superfamily hydrolase involved in NAD metabolism